MRTTYEIGDHVCSDVDTGHGVIAQLTDRWAVVKLYADGVLSNATATWKRTTLAKLPPIDHIEVVYSGYQRTRPEREPEAVSVPIVSLMDCGITPKGR
jgi:hypothetical protein